MQWLVPLEFVMFCSFPDMRERIARDLTLCLLFLRLSNVSNDIDGFSVVGKCIIVYFLLKNGAV